MAGAKESLVSQEEVRHKALVAELVKRAKAMTDLIGPRKFGERRASLAEKAALYLPEFYVLGNADPEISGPWWQRLVHQHGPADAAALSILMEDLYESPEYGLLATRAMDAVLRQLFEGLKATINPNTGRPYHRGLVLHSAWWRSGKSRAERDRWFTKTFKQAA